LPAYTIEPPDILLIDAVRVVPRNPRIEALDSLLIQFPAEPEAEEKEIPSELLISGIFPVEVDGTVNLGVTHGAVAVGGKTLPEVKAAIEKRLAQRLKKEVVTRRQVVVQLAESRGLQQIRGEHLVRPDGTVGLGIYGSVPVAGLTLEEAKAAIESHLAQELLNPQISLDVYAYNSKVYYVIFDGGGFGQQIYPLPVTGSETVLDAISKVNGLSPTSSRKHIWIARPFPGEGGEQVIPVDWKAITMHGSTATNYQLLPGDRVYVKADHLITFDNFIAKLTAPFERMFGFTLLGNSTVRTLQQSSDEFNNNFGGSGGF
jgi:polysaccharide export outer membrane protein